MLKRIFEAWAQRTREQLDVAQKHRADLEAELYERSNVALAPLLPLLQMLPELRSSGGPRGLTFRHELPDRTHLAVYLRIVGSGPEVQVEELKSNRQWVWVFTPGPDGLVYQSRDARSTSSEGLSRCLRIMRLLQEAPREEDDEDYLGPIRMPGDIVQDEDEVGADQDLLSLVEELDVAEE